MILHRLATLLIFTVLSIGAGAAPAAQNVEKILNQSIELYNKQQYPESLKLLDSIRLSREQIPVWYYYYGLNQARLRLYDDSLANFASYIRKTDHASTARAYYFTGLVQFYKGEYERAGNSLELASDLSTDPKLDRVIDQLIERTLKYREYYETHTATNVNFLLGYNYDTDVLNISKELSTENLTGNIFNYGVSLSHRVIDQYNFIFEPSVAVLDTYTLDSTFKANSTVQANDLLQALVSAPVIFYVDDAKSSTRYDISLNAYTSYLPISSQARELYLSSLFLKGKTVTQLSSRFYLNVTGTAATDTSYAFTSDDDDASGLRLELYTSLVQYLSKEKNYSLSYDLGASTKNAKGINPRFTKYSAGLGYGFPSFMGTVSFVKLGFENLSYKDKAIPRTDSKSTFDYVLSKSLSAQSSLGVSFGADSNTSNVELYKYNDFNVGFQYLTGFGF